MEINLASSGSIIINLPLANDEVAMFANLLGVIHLAFVPDTYTTSNLLASA
jgi:hypothetical protein